MKSDNIEIKVSIEINGKGYNDVYARAERIKRGEIDPQDSEGHVRNMVEDVLADAIASLDQTLAIKSAKEDTSF